jgi:hypothetical protein
MPRKTTKKTVTNPWTVEAVVAECKRLQGLSSVHLGEAALRENARAADIEIPAEGDAYDMSSAIVDAVESRIGGLFHSAALRWGVSVDEARARVEAAW